jgi:hypothetical protein
VDLGGGIIVARVLKMGLRMPKAGGADDYLRLRGGPEWLAMAGLRWRGIPIMNIPLRLIYFVISTVIPPLARIAPMGIWRKKK